MFYFNRSASSQRLFGVSSWEIIISSDKMRFQLLSNVLHHCVIAYSSARTRSLWVYSSWVFVNLIAVLFCIPSHIIQFNAHLYSPMLSVQLAHSGVFKSAYPCSSKLAASFGYKSLYHTIWFSLHLIELVRSYSRLLENKVDGIYWCSLCQMIKQLYRWSWVLFMFKFSWLSRH